MKLPIYMDYHSTTPLDSRVLEAMMPFLTDKFGNAASRSHPFGWEAEESVEHARADVAKIIGANPKEIVFTSGATESINIALKGAAEMYKEKGNHIITVATEHKATLDSAKYLEKHGGCEVTYLPVDKFGMVNPDDVKNAITDKTILVSVMHANNEVGTIHPIAEIGKITRERGVILEEIKMDEDSPDYLVHEIFTQNFWNDHPLGKPILGTKETVKKFERDPVFNLDVPTSCPDVPAEVLMPKNTWSDKSAYDAQAKKLATMFTENFKRFEATAKAEVKAAGPKA